jgi:hypothetical protein
MSPFGGALAPQRTKAPPCMRWRSLARPSGHSPPIPRRPVTRPAADCPATTGLDTRPRIRSPGSPAVSGVSPGSVSAFVVSAFLLPGPGLTQGFPPHSQNSLAIHRARCRYPLRTGACPPLFPHHGPQAAHGGRPPPAAWPAAAGRPPRARRSSRRRYRPSAYGCGECPDAPQWVRRRGPSMYEMEGPRSVAQPSTPIAQLPVARLLSAADRTTDPDTRLGNFGFPCSPCVPGSPPEFRGFPRIGIRVRW